jgi:Uma2 family endonuclease
MSQEKLGTLHEISVQPTAAEAGGQKIPPLKHGDLLTRDEFHRRYEATPHLKKIELIEGVVYMGSPVRHTRHSQPHGHMMGWLAVYHAGTPGTDFGDNATVRLNDNNEVQPDAFLRLESGLGGHSQIGGDDYIEGTPELIIEIAASSTDYDLNIKFEVYQHCGVQEYIVWQTEDGQLDWFRLVKGVYVPLQVDAAGIIKSRAFPGLRLAVKALLTKDLATVLVELQKGLDTHEHTAFADRLSKP